MALYDVIIIGAGVAGMSAASALANRGLRVAIIDSATADAVKTGECLMADALPIMARLGLSEDFLGAKHRSLQSYRVAWGQQNTYERHLLTSPTGAGWIVNRQHFDAMLLAHCQQQQVQMYWQCALKTVVKDTSGDWQLYIKGAEPQSLSARFVIDASGRARAFTRRLGIAKQQVDQLVASCCHIHSNCELSAAQATIISDKQGWWYYAKYSNTQASLCYFSDADLPLPNSSVALLSAANNQPLLVELLADAKPITSTFKRCAAYSSALQYCVGDDWLAIGDAALSFDPLSSYGMTSALSSAFYASQALLRYFNNEPQYLYIYQQLMQQNFLSYLNKRHQEYEKVDNPNSLFWQRRRQCIAA
jgi:flavin-dependent dehydrogenase